MPVTRVLIFPAEGVNAEELHDALSRCVNIEVWGCSSVERHGKYLFKNYYSGMPSLSNPSFYASFSRFLVDHEIDVVIPTHDTVAMEFAQNADRIPAKVLVADSRTSEICRSKTKTYEVFSEEPFVPRVYSKENPPSDYPVFAKPDDGQGAVGARMLRNAEEFMAVDFEREVVSEYLPGQEMTVDCFTDSKGQLRVVSPRTRDRIQAGIAVASRSVKPNPDIMRMADSINGKLAFLGLWFFQVKQDAKGIFKLMEISTRCAGTMRLTRALGYNLPLMSVYAALGKDLDVIDNNYSLTLDRTLHACFQTDIDYDIVYLDYDDTLIERDKVNLDAVRFLFQCKNKGIPVVLITRHEGDLDASFMEHGISSELFEQVILLKDGQCKSDYIVEGQRAVFIDNAFKERLLVSKHRHIPVFDVSEIEVLQDYRF